MTEPAIEFKLGAAAHLLTTNEAHMLSGLLLRTASIEARSLAESIDDGIAGRRLRRIVLGLDDIRALRGVLCVGDVLSHNGLVMLAEALCARRPHQGRRI